MNVSIMYANRMYTCTACGEPIELGEKYSVHIDMKHQIIERWHLECGCEVGEYSIDDQPINPNE